ncbi:MAG: hypothetical protein D6714_04500 [Bacteroidetes bacterium]|nr:MAG: hypothetical protein D6714_04500 [Bacteroidota bacterium]
MTQIFGKTTGNGAVFSFQRRRKDKAFFRLGRTFGTTSQKKPSDLFRQEILSTGFGQTCRPDYLCPTRRKMPPG